MASKKYNIQHFFPSSKPPIKHSPDLHNPLSKEFHSDAQSMADEATMFLDDVFQNLSANSITHISQPSDNTPSAYVALGASSTVHCDSSFNIERVIGHQQQLELHAICDTLSTDILVTNDDKDIHTRQYYYQKYQKHIASFKSMSLVPLELYHNTIIDNRYSTNLENVLLQLSDLRMRLVPVPGTGPCLFYSVSMALYSNLEEAANLRKQALLYIEHHFYDAVTIKTISTSLRQVFYYDHCIQNDPPNSEQDLLRYLNRYIKTMTNHLCEGSILELLALALLYRFNFVLWNMPSGLGLKLQQPEWYNYSALFPNRPIINLAFYNNHFDPLFTWNGAAWSQDGRSSLTSTSYQDIMVTCTTRIRSDSSNEPIIGNSSAQHPCHYSTQYVSVSVQEKESISQLNELHNDTSIHQQEEDNLVTQTHLRLFHKQSTLDPVIQQEPSRIKKNKESKLKSQQTILRQTIYKPPVINGLARLEQQINVGVYNVGGHTKTLSAAQLVPSLFLAKNLDILLLVDTRISSKSEAGFKARLKETLVVETGVTLYSTMPGNILNSQLHNDVGGLAIILSPRLAKLVVKRFFDPSALGLAGGVLIQQKCGRKLLIIVTYWPTRTSTNDNNTLWSRVKQYLITSNNKSNPLQYVQHLVAEWIQTAQQHDWHVLVGGDFNAGYGTKEGTHHNLQQWSQTLSLTHCLHQKGTYLVTRPHSKVDLIKGTMIEHILISGPFELVHAEVEQSSFARTFSDHLPMIQQFNYQTHAPIAPFSPKAVGIELKLRNPAVIQIFQQELLSYVQLAPQHMNTRDSITQSAQRVEQIQADIYRVAANLAKKFVYPKLQFWTPIMIANNYHQQFIITVLKAIDHKDRTQLHRQLPTLIANLKTKVLQLNRPSDPNATETIDITILNIEQTAIEDWPVIIKHSSNCKQVLKYHLKVLQTKLQYRTRKLQFALIGKHRLENEQLRETRNYKKLLGRMFKRYSQPIDEIVLPDKSIISDPCHIHIHLTKQLKTHHSLNTQRTNIDWDSLLTGNLDIKNIDSLQHIPQHLLLAFQQALRKHSKSTLLTTMSATLNAPVTFEMFQREIMSKAKDKSPGLSGVTINMLRNTPESLLFELYSHINTLWMNRSHPDGRVVPNSWLNRWISVIPKDKLGPIQLDRIRPISLYEVTRKIWTGILNKRIMYVWEQEKALHTAQYGYRSNRGTDTAILQLINLIEDADEFKKTFFLMGFDTKKAFDAVNKRVMRIAWIRLGIPSDIAEYLTELDKDGLTVIKSQHANKVYHHSGQTAVLSKVTSENTAEAYVALDGIGQGDSTSATAWVALYDILLCMLDHNPHQPYMYQVNQQDCAVGYSLAFADDLNTISAAKPHLQSTIDLVSAFNAITGFQANDKLECGTNAKSNEEMVVHYHDHLWFSHEIKIVHKLTIKILGVPIDLTNNWYDLETLIKNRIQQSTLPIKSNNSSSTSKALAYQMAIIPTVIYAAKFLNRSITEIQKLLSPIQTFLRITQKLQKSYPNVLLYISNTFGGLNLTDITMQIQKAKHRMIKRALSSNSSVNFAVQAMIARCYRQSVREPSQTLLYSEYQKSWVTSYIEQQGNNNLYLTPTQETIDPLINTCSPKVNSNLVDWLAARTETDTFRDILYPTNHQDLLRNVNYQINPNHPLVPLLQFNQPLGLPTPHVLHIGRRYLTTDNRVLEFRGKLLEDAYESNLIFRQWIPYSATTRVKLGTKLKVNVEATQYNQDILGHLKARVYCEMTANQKGYITQSSIASIIPDNPPQVRAHTIRRQLILSKSKPRVTVDIFTDASIKYAEGNIEEALFGIKKIESITGGAVMMHNEQVVECISIPIPITFLTFPDSFEAEALTLLSTLIHFKDHIQGANLYTDSQSLTKTLVKRPEGECLPDHPLVNTIRHVRRQCSLNITWINSHADNCKKRADWTYLETGNIAADALTRCDLKTFKQIYPNVSLKTQHKVVAVPSSEIQQMILKAHKLLVTDHKQRFLPFKHQVKQWKERQLNNYLVKRTNRSTRKICWKELTIQFSRKVLTQCGFKHIKRSKLIFDKYANEQYNSNKHTCPFCNEGEDTRAHLLNCTHEQLVQIRELTEMQITQLPLPIEYWEDTKINQLIGQGIREALLQNILADDRSRLGLFTPLQVTDICKRLEKYQDSKLTTAGIRRDLIDILQITAKGLEKLIQCRNNKVYRQSKEVTTTISKLSSSVTKNRFHSLVLDDIEKFQITTTQVLHQFPSLLTFIDSNNIYDLSNPTVTIEGVIGVLYHFTTINTNIVYEKFVSLDIPSILWPDYSYSTPLQYDHQSKTFNIHLSKPRLGEHIYYDRFIYLIKHGLKLINNNGFTLIFEELNNQVNLTSAEQVYIQNYTNIYQKIQSASDVIIFLNWYATDGITKDLEQLLRQIQIQPKEDSIIYNTLVTPSKLKLQQLNESLMIEIPIGKAHTSKRSMKSSIMADTIQICDISNYQLSKEQLNNPRMQNIDQQIKDLLSKFNDNKLKTQSTQINTSIKEDLIELKKKLKTTNNIHVYYKELLKEKLSIFHQHVNRQKYSQAKKIQNPQLFKEQKSITEFFKLQQTKHYTKVESTDIFNSND